MKEAFKSLTTAELLTVCIYGEARSEGLDGMCAVGSVVLNRVKADGWFGKTIKEVILKPKQFSCFNVSDPGYPNLLSLSNSKYFYAKLGGNQLLRQCFHIAVGLLEGYLYSNVGSATHYHTKSSDPKWDDNMLLVNTIGNHEFFMEKK